MCDKRFVLIISCCMSFALNAGFLDSFKGIGSSIESFPLFKGSFYTGMARTFGAPPAGYVYSFSVYNDTTSPVYIGIQEMVSIMGGCFPKGGGWSVTTVAPFAHHTMLDKEYYFEMLIKTTSRSPSNHMPYLHHSDAIYQQEAIQLQEPHSTKHHYFRSYVGKELQSGVWAYMPKAEYLGFADPSAKGPHANKGLSLSSSLTSLTIKNSTDKDYYVGYTSQVKATAMTARTCQVFALVQSDSFALYNAPASTSLRPGTIGVFDAKNESLLQTYDLHSQGFDGKSYTLELAHADLSTITYTYEDTRSTAEKVLDSAASVAAAVISKGKNSGLPSNHLTAVQHVSKDGPGLKMFMQGLMPGHYDVPTSKVRDITPITCVFWYQAAAGKKGLIDLPGKMWIVSQGADQQISVSCAPGNAIQFDITRPQIDKVLWLYFLYVDSVDDAKAQVFIKNFITSKIGSDTVTQYHEQSEQQMKRAQKHVTDLQAIVKGAVSKPKASEALLVQAVDGALKMHQGRITDPASGLTGYLLGGDLFLSEGVGAGTMYYQLAPSWKNTGNLPTMAVQNVYASTLSSVAPKGLPTPTVTSGALTVVNSTATAAPAQALPAPTLLQKASSWVKSKVAKASAAPAVAPVVATSSAAPTVATTVATT